MPRHLLILLFTLSLVHPAQAGAWLREKGTSFSSFAFTGTYALDTTSQTYLEYGLTEKMTLGADIGYIRPRNALHGGYATFFMRRPISAPDAASKWSYDLGIGASWIGDQILPHLRAGLSWGKGMTWGEKSGWMNVDASVTWNLATELHLAKIDTTIGVNFTEVTTGMVQIYLAHLAQDTFATVAPSLVFSPGKSKFRIQVGLESPLEELRDSSIKIGLWRNF